MSDLTDSDIERATDTMQRAQQSYTAEIERNLRQLVRSDGQPKFAPAEHQERERAIREAAAETRDAVLGRYMETAESAIAEAERAIAMLDGADRLTSLAPDDAGRAVARRPFVEEDCQLPAYRLEHRVAAVVAAGDVVEALLFDRYLRRRLEGEQTQPEQRAINALLEKLQPLTADPDAKKKREAAAALKERGRKLRFAVWGTTREENVAREVERLRSTVGFL